MFELTFLGTAASAPLPKRNLSSAIVSHDEYRFMVDCGEGTQRQLLSSGLGVAGSNTSSSPTRTSTTFWD